MGLQNTFCLSLTIALTCFEPENTPFHHKGKYHCTTDLVFDWFGFDQTSKSAVDLTYAKQLNPSSKTGGQPYSDSPPYEVSGLCLSHKFAA